MAYSSTCLVIIHFLYVFLALVKSSIIHLPETESVQEVARFKPLIEGYVYCKYNMNNIDDEEETLTDATPLAGAGVSLNCKSDKSQVIEITTTTTKEKGYFSIIPSKPLSYEELQKCKVYLSSNSQDKNCNIQSDLNGGLSGANLHLKKHELIKFKLGKTPLLLQKFTVGPFAFHSSEKMVKSTTHNIKPELAKNVPCDKECSVCPMKGCCYCEINPDHTCFCA